MYWKVAERKLPSGCQLCKKPIAKGDKIWCYHFTAYKANRLVYIHADHFNFHNPNTCEHRYKTLTDNEIHCPLCNGLQVLDRKQILQDKIQRRCKNAKMD